MILNVRIAVLLRHASLNSLIAILWILQATRSASICPTFLISKEHL
jgi:hypothetical protein